MVCSHTFLLYISCCSVIHHILVRIFERLLTSTGAAPSSDFKICCALTTCVNKYSYISVQYFPDICRRCTFMQCYRAILDWFRNPWRLYSNQSIYVHFLLKKFADVSRYYTFVHFQFILLCSWVVLIDSRFVQQKCLSHSLVKLIFFVTTWWNQQMLETCAYYDIAP